MCGTCVILRRMDAQQLGFDPFGPKSNPFSDEPTPELHRAIARLLGGPMPRFDANGNLTQYDGPPQRLKRYHGGPVPEGMRIIDLEENGGMVLAPLPGYVEPPPPPKRRPKHRFKPGRRYVR